MGEPLRSISLDGGQQWAHLGQFCWMVVNNGRTIKVNFAGWRSTMGEPFRSISLDGGQQWANHLAQFRWMVVNNGRAKIVKSAKLKGH